MISKERKTRQTNMLPQKGKSRSSLLEADIVIIIIIIIIEIVIVIIMRRIL